MGSDQHSDPPQPGVGSGLTITTGEEPGAVVLVVSGALDYHSSERFAAAVTQAFATGTARIVADLGRLSYCDSSGVAAMVRAHKLAAGDGRLFVVRHPNTTLARVFALTGLDAILAIEN